MGDYIPLEELEKFMASCNDASAQKTSREATEKLKIQADNVGHKLLSKMGWKEGSLSLSLTHTHTYTHTNTRADTRVKLVPDIYMFVSEIRLDVSAFFQKMNNRNEISS